MRYLTKQWYQTMTDSGLGALLKADSRAEHFSEASFRQCWREEEERWLKDQAEFHEFGGEPMDENEERRRFWKMYRSSLAEYKKRLPAHIFQQVADIRMLALGFCTEQVMELIREYQSSCRIQTEKTMDACYEQQKATFPEEKTELLRAFNFHDEHVLSSRKNGQDWVIDFDTSRASEQKVSSIRFVNARIRYQEKRLFDAWWLYGELYKTETGYEVHVLLDKKGLIEWMLTCDDIVLEYTDPPADIHRNLDNFSLICRMMEAGISFKPGMTAEELDRAEVVFGFRFPKEIRGFLSFAVPVGKDFFDYRDVSEENQKAFRNFQEWLEAQFRFDLANCREDMLELLAEPLGNPADFDNAVLEYYHSSVKLIPFYAHRCFFDGLDGMPIVSFWQPVDSIFYGSDFQVYLEVEFLEKELDVKELPEQRLKESGIWQYLVTP